MKVRFKRSGRSGTKPLRIAALLFAATIAVGGTVLAGSGTANAGPAAVAGQHASADGAHVTVTRVQATPRTVRPADPGPECNGNEGFCWQYYDWYWTYSNCNNEGSSLVNSPGSNYIDWVCSGGHGLVVWLWLEKYEVG
jgi:hypothetical protein